MQTGLNTWPNRPGIEPQNRIGQHDLCGSGPADLMQACIPAAPLLYSLNRMFVRRQKMGCAVNEIDEKYLARLRTYWKRHNAFPSMAKLCEVLGLASTSSVFALVGRLTEAGYLERVEGRIAPSRQFLRPAHAGPGTRRPAAPRWLRESLSSLHSMTTSSTTPPDAVLRPKSGDGN